MVLHKIKDKISKLKDLAVLGTANVLNQMILAVFWLYMAAFLGSEGYGEISYLIAIAGIVYVIAMFGTGDAITVFTAKEKKTQSSIHLFALISGSITSVVTFIILQNFGVSLFVIGFVIFGLATSEVLGHGLYRDFARFRIIQRILQVVLALVFYYFIGLEGILIGFALSFLPFAFKVAKALQASEIDLKIIKNHFHFLINSYGLTLSRRLSLSLDKLIIFPVFGSSLLGNYQLGFQILLIMSILPNTIYEYVLPRDAKGISNKKIIKYTIIISIILALSSIFLSPIALLIFFPDFEEATDIIKIISVAIIPMSVSAVLISKLYGIGKSKSVFLSSLIFLSVQIPFIFILGNWYGINGVAISLVLAHSSQAVFLLNSSKRV